MKLRNFMLGGLLVLNIAFASASITDSTGSRFAVVDMHAVLEGLPKLDTMRKDLEKKFSVEHDEIAKEQTKIQDEAKKVERDSSVMTKADLAKAKENIQKQQRSLQERQIKFQQTVYTAQDKVMKTVIDEVTAVVATIAKENKYVMVFPKVATIYSQDSADITAKVKAKLGK